MIGFALGWFCGCVFMWTYFRLSGLIRTREEYYASLDRAQEKQ